MRKRVAIVLRGHIRTWEYNAPAVFKFCDDLDADVDFFTAVWQTPGVKVHKFQQQFINFNYHDNLKSMIFPKPQDYAYSGWMGPAFLSGCIAPFVNLQHSRKPYDMLIDTRPDVIYARNNKSIIWPDANTVYTTGITNYKDIRGLHCVGMQDHFLISTPEVFTKLTNRIAVVDKESKECHADFLRFCSSLNVNVSDVTDWVNVEMSRPNDVDQYPDPLTYFTPLNEPKVRWEEISVEKRLQYLEDQNIEKWDYITDNRNIGIGTDFSDILKQEDDKMLFK